MSLVDIFEIVELILLHPRWA